MADYAVFSTAQSGRSQAIGMLWLSMTDEVSS